MSLLARVLDPVRARGWDAASLDESLDAAAAWLARAQDATADDGVAAAYDARRKQWSASYPETTGYIIPTLYHYATRRGDVTYRERATRMALWECEIQLADGGVRAGTMEATTVVPTIFNTGQVLFGWASAFEQTGDPRFAESLRRASDWLVQAQDPDGAWRRFASPFATHALNTYNTRVAFGLARAARVLGEPRYAAAALANIDWALGQKRESGWLDNNDLEHNDRPLTHTIAYAIRGILEVGALTDTSHLVITARDIARAVAATQRRDGALPGRLDVHWRPAARWSCLTGNCQMAIIWLRLAALTGDLSMRDHAKRAIAYTQTTQSLTHRDMGRRGAIGGSQPLRGGYMRYRYPNWATNFFMTAILLLDEPERVF